MNLQFYLFDVDHGQSAALRLPNGKWCLFDAGNTSGFSPTKYLRTASGLGQHFSYHKATISHWHGDHLADFREMFEASPSFMRTVPWDNEFLTDVEASSSEESWPQVLQFGRYYHENFSGNYYPDYGGVTISELSLFPGVARGISGSPNSAVNNASVITRINWHDYSILLCGDMEAEAWEFVLSTPGWRETWRPQVAGVDLLVAPHHGHESGYSSSLMQVANPGIVLVSVKSGDEHVDDRYSQVRGIWIDSEPYKRITTRQKGSILVDVASPATLFAGTRRSWTFDVDGRRAAARARWETLRTIFAPTKPTMPTLFTPFPWNLK